MIAIFIAMSFALSACNSVTKIDDFKEKIENAESIELSVSIEALGMEYSYTMKIDGDKAYYADSETEPYYTEIKENGYLYTYTKTADGWVSDYGRYVSDTSDNDPLAEYALDELFNGKNYEYSREYKVYMARSDVDISFDGIELLYDQRFHYRGRSARQSGDGIQEYRFYRSDYPGNHDKVTVNRLFRFCSPPFTAGFFACADRHHSSVLTPVHAFYIIKKTEVNGENFI